MRSLWSNPILASRYPFAIAAGLVLAAAFPNFGIAGLAWVAPGMLLAASAGKRGWESFRIGYVAALSHYLVSLYWLLHIPYAWHGIPLGPAAAWLSLSAFVALFPAAWVWLMAMGRDPLPSRPPGSPGAPLGQQDDSAVDRAIPACANWVQRTLWALSGAAAWVAFEMVLARIFSGFPWNPLGSSQYRLTPLIQVASVTGVYGVSFLLVWFSLSLVSAALVFMRNPGARTVWVREVCLPVLVAAVAFHAGFRIVRSAPEPERGVQLTLVQPSIPQTLIWDPNGDTARFREMLALSEQALTNKTDVLIWPEAAVPKLIRFDEEISKGVIDLVRRHRVWMILGADDAEPGRDSSRPEDATYYNSSFLISPEGQLVEDYRKRSLVIFGEYIPLLRWLPFLKWFTPIQGGFTAGDKAERFDMKGLDATASVLICFEDVFPHVSRSAALTGPDFLVNLTNDGWFGESAAQWQQAATGLFRAVENRLPLVRCTNNGLTCWIDAQGRIRQIFRDATGSVYGKGFMSFRLPLPPAGTGEATFYTRYGDVFGWGCVSVTAGMVAGRVIRRRNALSIEH